MSLKCIVFLYVIKYIIVNDCFVICVGSSLLSKTVDVESPYDLTLFFMLVQFWVTELYPCVWKNTVFNCEHFCI